MYTISEIETAIVNGIRGNAEAASLAPTIGPYHGEIEDIAAEVARMTIPLPAVLVLYAGSAFTEPANRSYDDEMSFDIVVICKNLSGREGQKDAIYPVLEAIKEALIDQTFGLDIEPIRPRAIDPVAVMKAFSVYAFTVGTSFSME